VSNNEGDRFVGVKADEEDAVVFFPVGYSLPATEQELRRDIVHLIQILSSFANKKDELLSVRSFLAPQTVNFPIHAYLTVVNHYLHTNSYYAEKERRYRVSSRGKTDWSRTAKRQKPIMQPNGSLVFLQRETLDSSLNENNLITKIHEWCVYEGFSKLGWLFTSIMPKKPTITFQKAKFLGTIQDKLGKTFNDNDKQLFQSMLSMIKYIDERSQKAQFYFGTDRFEYVWERIVDRIFGVENKNLYFPKTHWKLLHGHKKENSALEPDTVAVQRSNVYILDAKYYRYGVTGDIDDLPNSSSINKQITYGEYVAADVDGVFRTTHGDGLTVYNAFIMPYNQTSNRIGADSLCARIGEATGAWKTNGNTYERVQGIVIDTRYALWHCTGNTQSQIDFLIAQIESAFS
jgi:hypothetical protein